jgi:hypothetical protein
VNIDLQMANVELRKTVAELTTLHAVGTAIASVLDLNSLLDMVLQVVTEELDFPSWWRMCATFQRIRTRA